MTAHETNESGQGQAQGQPQGPEGGSDSRVARTHLSAAGLRARGWTAAMVRQLLGEPDLFRVNPYARAAPHPRAAPRIRLYCVERVEAAERSEEFRAVTAAAVRRSAAARVVARRRLREVLARIAAEPIDVPRLAPRELARLAVEYRDRRDGAAGTVGSADPGGLDRWKVDCLRHQLARYDELLDGLRGGAGWAAAEELLRGRVYAAIAEAYPLLARECERQLSRREDGPPPD